MFFNILGFVSNVHHFLFVSAERKSEKYDLSKLSICFYDSCSCAAILGFETSREATDMKIILL